MLYEEKGLLFLIAVIVVVLIALLAFIFFVIFRNIKIRQLKEVEIRDAIITTQNNEQNRIAEDLHDELAPMLSAIKLQLNNMENIGEENMAVVKNCSKQIDKSIEDLRLISRSLSGQMIVNNGLVPSIEDSLNLFVRQSKISFVTNFDVDENMLGDAVKVNIYKILIELIHNTIRHSNANKIQVSLKSNNEQLAVNYSDNGSSGKKNAKKAGLGTVNIANRLRLINADNVSMNSDFSGGARYEFLVSLKKDSNL